MKPKAIDMELAVVALLDFRRHAIVPNVWWGMDRIGHECDILALDKKLRFTEVEIKTSKSDFDKDFDKPHGHVSPIISRLVYAVPDHIQEHALTRLRSGVGLIVVSENPMHRFRPERHPRWIANWKRIPKHVQHRVPNQAEIAQFLRLGTMRIWPLKHKLRKIQTR